jgi:predicted chitinase
VTHGYFTSSGHIVCIVGYNSQGLIIHDPYGKWTEGGYDRNDDSNPEKGKAVVYDYAMIQRTCMTDGQFWVHFIAKPGHQPTATTSANPNLITAPGSVPSKLKNLLTITQNMANLLTADQLIQIAGVSAPRDRLRELAPSVNQTLERYQINTALRIAHFIAQVAHESDCFNAMEEYASGEDYEGRDDLGNTQPGDGVRFKGRGLIQLTGRSNYASFSKAMNVDFMAQPTLVAQAPYAVLVAGWFWDKNQLNQLADRDDLREVTRTINGGYNGLEDREHYLQAAKRVLNC